jgi:outer membrane protein, multidrug efflux system
MRPILPLLASLLLLSCASAPRVQHPKIDLQTPPSWTDGSASTGTTETSWWRGFALPYLDELVAEALENNYDLQAAATRLQLAQAQARIAGAPLQPQVTASANSSRRKQNFIGLPIPGGGVASSTSDNFGVNLNLSWELDLWGRLRAGQAAALADLQAAEADLAGARLSLAAQTARAFFAAVEAGRQVQLARATVDNYHISTEQIHSRYRRGLRSSLDLRLGRANLASAEGLLQQRQQQLDRTLRQLELLLGRYPSAGLELPDEFPSLLEEIPTGLPAQLVSRRPDLAAAERRLAAADKRLAEARSALYPRIGLTASGGRSSEELGDLLDGDFGIWNLLANITQPLLQGGRLRAGVDMARAGEEQALAIYAGSVLRAYAEVESALAGERFLAAQETALQTATREALAARQLAEERYAKGLSDLITMLEAQRRAFDAESRLLAVRRQRIDARIDLHLALGGGFSASDTSTDSGDNYSTIGNDIDLSSSSQNKPSPESRAETLR